MYLKYSVFNTPTFRIKMMKNWFVLMIQWLTHTSLVSLMDESVFLNKSRMNDSITNTFLTVTCHHLVEKWCNRHKRYLKRQLLSGSILIATIDINVCSRTINSYPSISMNDCKTEIILCSCKDCLWSFFLPKHVNCLLSGSAECRFECCMILSKF